jgi:flavodoxin I
MGRLVMSLLIFSSKTGNTKTFADFIQKYIGVVVGDYNSNITQHQKILIGAYTWGDGKIPKDLKQFLVNNKDNWKGKEVFIFGSGNSIYPKFCGAVDGIEKILEDCGADIIGTFKFEQRFNERDYYMQDIVRLLIKLR